MPHCFVGQKWSQRVPEGSWRKEVLFCWKAPTNALLNTWAHSLLGNFPIFVRETFNERFLSNVNTYGSTNSCRWRLSKWKPDRSRSCSSTKAQNSQTRRCFHHLVSGWLKNWLCWFKKNNWLMVLFGQHLHHYCAPYYFDYSSVSNELSLRFRLTEFCRSYVIRLTDPTTHKPVHHTLCFFYPNLKLNIRNLMCFRGNLHFKLIKHADANFSSCHFNWICHENNPVVKWRMSKDS